jgi:polysaccharide deacetylase family protein (PEP-CTERM system associated)
MSDDTNKIFTVDVEEYYHAENVWSSVSNEERENMPGRVEIGVRKILNLLEKYGSKATFFVLGCVAVKNKELIKEIVSAGHEIAAHGYWHRPLFRHTAETFNEDLKKVISVLEEITGKKIIGYRSPSFSLSEKEDWVFNILKSNGITYDSSSAFSVLRGSFRQHRQSPGCFEISEGLLELAITSLKVGPIDIPMGGGYFRAFPYALTRSRLSQEAGKDKEPFVFYIHPWELDPEQPKVKMSAIKTFRHYINIDKTGDKLEKLLNDIKFTSIGNYLKMRNLKQ